MFLLRSRIEFEKTSSILKQKYVNIAPMKFKALFIDVDGTAVTSEARNEKIIADMVRPAGIDMTPEKWIELFSDPTALFMSDVFAQWSEKFTEIYPTARAFEDAYFQETGKRLSEIEPIEEVRDIVHQFLENGIDVSAVSSSPDQVVEQDLAYTGYLTDEFAQVIGKDTVVNNGLLLKPFGDPYIYALDRLNDFRDGEAKEPALPSECLVLEDTKTGSRAALKAGMTVIQIIDDKEPMDLEETVDLIAEHGGNYYSCTFAELETLLINIGALPSTPAPRTPKHHP